MHKYLLILCLTAAALAASDNCGFIAKPLITMSEGATGGIAYIPPTFQLIVLPEANGKSHVYVLRRDKERQVACRQGVSESFASLQKELELGSLPHQSDGMADPYAFNVGLHSHDGKTCWANQPPTGCVRGPVTVHPTDEQKAKFLADVRRLEKLADVATEPLTEKEFEAVQASLYKKAE